MKTFIKILKFTGVLLLGIIGAFFIYANLETPPLHAQAKPVDMVILKSEDLETTKDILEETLDKTNGITAFAVNSESKLISITFDPEIISKEQLNSTLKTKSATISKANFETTEPSGPQCPVPMEYILKFEKLKYAFCIR